MNNPDKKLAAYFFAFVVPFLMALLIVFTLYGESPAPNLVVLLSVGVVWISGMWGGRLLLECKSNLVTESTGDSKERRHGPGRNLTLEQELERRRAGGSTAFSQ